MSTTTQSSDRPNPIIDRSGVETPTPRDASASDANVDPSRTSLGRRISRRMAVVVFVLTSGWLVYPRLLSPVVAERSQVMVEQQLATNLLNGTAPLGGDIPAGTPVALLEIPSVELRRAVVEGTESEQLATGPGHLSGSVLPGQVGVSAILGRSGTFGADFARLDDVRVDDGVVVTTGQGVSTFRVLDITRRAADDRSAFVGEGNMLLLITATGGDDADGRLVVRAELTSDPLPVGLPNEVVNTTGDLGLGGSRHAGVDLLAWTLVLMLLTVVSGAVRRLVGPRVSWMIVAPPALLAGLQVLHQLALLAPSMH